MINKLKIENDYLNKVFNADKLAEMNESEETFKVLQFEISNMKLSIDNASSKTDI